MEVRKIVIFGPVIALSLSFLTNQRKRQLSNYNASIVTSKKAALLNGFPRTREINHGVER